MEGPFDRKDRDPLEVGHPIVVLLREDLKAGAPSEELINAFREAELAVLDAEQSSSGEPSSLWKELIAAREEARTKLFRRLVDLEMYFEANENLRERIEAELSSNPNGPKSKELYDEFLSRHSIRPADASEPVAKRRRRLFAYFNELEKRCPDLLGQLIRREIASNDFPNDTVWEAALATLAPEGRSDLSDPGVVSAIQDAVDEMFLQISLPVPRGDSPSTRASLRAAHQR